MSNVNYDDLTKKCKNIIRTNNPKNSIEKISKIESNKKEIGKKKHQLYIQCIRMNLLNMNQKNMIIILIYINQKYPKITQVQ